MVESVSSTSSTFGFDLLFLLLQETDARKMIATAAILEYFTTILNKAFPCLCLGLWDEVLRIPIQDHIYNRRCLAVQFVTMLQYYSLACLSHCMKLQMREKRLPLAEQSQYRLPRFFSLFYFFCKDSCSYKIVASEKVHFFLIHICLLDSKQILVSCNGSV